MADLQVRTEQPQAQTPLLDTHQNNLHQSEQQGEEREVEDEEDSPLEQTLQSLETFLGILGFRQCSKLNFVLSWTGFIFLGLLVPVWVLELSDCADCEEYQVNSFEVDIIGWQVCLAAASLGCLAHNLCKYGIRKFLFVDRYNGQMSRLRDQYIKQIKVKT